MSPAPCPRSFEVEAMRDGRLAGAELASFERHTSTCPACLREAEALASMAQALRSSLAQPVDELHVLRERTRLLAAFDRGLTVPARPSKGRRWMLWPVALAILVAGPWAYLHLRPVPRARPVPVAEVFAQESAVWSRQVEGVRERLLLEHGALRIHVDHSRGARRLLVVLPDGELEDIGTTFTVCAEDGHTTRIAVEEGSVVLRLRDRVAVFVGKGETWDREARSAPAPAANAGLPRLPESSLSVRSRDPARLAPRAHVRELREPMPVPDPLADFRAAVAALDRGDGCAAAAAFAVFIAQHPRDARGEDASYLRIIALQRCGDDRGMRAAAGEYLHRYPAGFRHAEAEKLAR